MQATTGAILTTSVKPSAASSSSSSAVTFAKPTKLCEDLLPEMLAYSKPLPTLKSAVAGIETNENLKLAVEDTFNLMRFLDWWRLFGEDIIGGKPIPNSTISELFFIFLSFL